MKQITLFILLVLVTACGSSKKVIESSKPTEKVEKDVVEKSEVEIIPEAPYETEEIIDIPDNYNPNQIIKPDSLGFHQDLTKHTFDSLDDFWTNFLQKNVSDNGNVNYESFRKDFKGLQYYIKFLQDSLPNNNASKEQKLAYWINAYNALTIDLILRNYPIKSIKDIDKPWDQRLWKFGEKWLNLNDIEHQILRKMDEPRIHFAIVCASFSCPKLQNKAFTASNLEAQLTEATKDFLADSDRNEISQNNLRLSKIFKWFAKDFKTDGSLIDFLNKYTEVEISSKAKKSFKDYNWDLND
ncbi:hypothetical protein BTO05_10870 [Winogradskyella sp. PC-19]|uniref:DUF547 domain-containing protein n=1 Tax=unclassified Winogradskyella TaxID=2615021 RepID=UPI000B3C9B14|nr:MULTISPECIES: DUF547 domain-containing protein [unclassified Winogradskyella]ARV10112.1 hypothetical protein BTO05_10870 [Winogradskyella sp. PC-19]RZN83559.1 MAG: DUF547 domain-containing protein [Winogradskyella sp.]